MRYSQEALEDMAQKVNLLEYCEKSVDFVKHSGDTHFAICPFHNEKTASLAVNETDNFFHCFGCGRSGNIYKWLQWQEGLSFDQAVQKVADITNSDVRDYMESESMSFYKLLKRLNNPKRNSNVDREVLDFERDYLQKFTSESPAEWIKEGISEKELKKYEIRVDPQSNRVVYPVRDSNFQMIGVKGRTRFKNYKDLKIMKYMNYYKIGILDYFTGMMQARDAIDDKGEVIIVEGLKSVMKIDQWGYHNVVSAETSTLNEYQIELLIRMGVKRVVIAFDKDVPLKKIQENARLLKRFTNCFVVVDKWRFLDNKDSPCDKGKEIWDCLYERKVRL